MAPTTLEALAAINSLHAIMAEAHAMAQGSTLMERPPGYFSTVEYADAYSISMRAAALRLDKLVRQGKAKKVHVLVATTGGPRRQSLYGINK